MYENAIRQYISNGRLSFFNTTITLSLEQRQRHIEYMEKILKAIENKKAFALDESDSRKLCEYIDGLKKSAKDGVLYREILIL